MFDDRIILITGAAGALGRAAAPHMQALNARLVLIDRLPLASAAAWTWPPTGTCKRLMSCRV